MIDIKIHGRKLATGYGKKVRSAGFYRWTMPDIIWFCQHRKWSMIHKPMYFRAVSNLICHESLHNVLDKVDGSDACAGLDTIRVNKIRKYFGCKTYAKLRRVGL